MESKLGEGLLKQSRDALAGQIAIWDNLSLGNMAWQKVKGKIQQGDALKMKIDEQIRVYSKRTACDLQILLFLRVADYLKIQLPKDATTRDLDQAFREIEAAALASLKRTDSTFTGESAHEMACHTVKKMMDSLSKNYAEMEPGEQEKVLESIMDSLDSMPEEQRERLRKELNVDELTQDKVRDALLKGTFGTAFAVVIQIAGFSAYVFAVKLLAAMAALIGLTLPFTVYIWLTSLMALFANPLFIAAGGFLGWAFLSKKTLDKIRDGLMPTVASQLILSSSLEGDLNEATPAFLNRYNGLVTLIANGQRVGETLNHWPGIGTVSAAARRS